MSIESTINLVRRVGWKLLKPINDPSLLYYSDGRKEGLVLAPSFRDLGIGLGENYAIAAGNHFFGKWKDYNLFTEVERDKALAGDILKVNRRHDCVSALVYDRFGEDRVVVFYDDGGIVKADEVRLGDKWLKIKEVLRPARIKREAV